LLIQKGTGTLPIGTLPILSLLLFSFWRARSLGRKDKINWMMKEKSQKTGGNRKTICKNPVYPVHPVQTFPRSYPSSILKDGGSGQKGTDTFSFLFHLTACRRSTGFQVNTLQ
jgi:hypothetical protein